jgi:hypothetical protein
MTIGLNHRSAIGVCYKQDRGASRRGKHLAAQIIRAATSLRANDARLKT